MGIPGRRECNINSWCCTAKLLASLAFLKMAYSVTSTTVKLQKTAGNKKVIVLDIRVPTVFYINCFVSSVLYINFKNGFLAKCAKVRRNKVYEAKTEFA